MMRSPYVRPATVASLLAVAVAGVIAGCGKYGAQREVVVTFKPGATQAQHDAARTACTGVVARSTPEPRPTSTLPSVRLNDVRFRVDAANDGELAKLYECLRQQPGVLGVDLPTQ
jgi:hypothetical protein